MRDAMTTWGTAARCARDAAATACLLDGCVGGRPRCFVSFRFVSFALLLLLLLAACNAVRSAAPLPGAGVGEQPSTGSVASPASPPHRAWPIILPSRVCIPRARHPEASGVEPPNGLPLSTLPWAPSQGPRVPSSGAPSDGQRRERLIAAPFAVALDPLGSDQRTRGSRSSVIECATSGCNLRSHTSPCHSILAAARTAGLAATLALGGSSWPHSQPNYQFGASSQSSSAEAEARYHPYRAFRSLLSPSFSGMGLESGCPGAAPKPPLGATPFVTCCPPPSHRRCDPALFRSPPWVGTRIASRIILFRPSGALPPPRFCLDQHLSVSLRCYLTDGACTLLVATTHNVPRYDVVSLRPPWSWFTTTTSPAQILERR
jgi:hypothetical protein